MRLEFRAILFVAYYNKGKIYLEIIKIIKFF
jgi:hypothetical protein